MIRCSPDTEVSELFEMFRWYRFFLLEINDVNRVLRDSSLREEDLIDNEEMLSTYTIVFDMNEMNCWSTVHLLNEMWDSLGKISNDMSNEKDFSLFTLSDIEFMNLSL